MPPAVWQTGRSPGRSWEQAMSRDEFASPASGEPDIDQPTGLPSNMSMTGER